jgi:HK97 family phage prohead protease
MTTREQAAALRASGVRAPADRPQERRCDEAAGSPAAARVRLTQYRIERATADAETVTFIGYASVTDTPYRMWDFFGEYDETVTAGAFADTLAAEPLVEFVVNHGRGGQLPMAHTRNATMTLAEDTEGLRVEATLDMRRTDVRDLVLAIERGDVAEMSFRFRIVRGRWSDDFSQYFIHEVDMDRGDTSPVNFGANPHTHIDAPARSDAGTGPEARDASSAAPVALGDQPAEQLTPTTTERTGTMPEISEQLAAEVVEQPTAARATVDTEAFEARIALLEQQLRQRDNVTAAERAGTPNAPAYDQVARVGAESRTYRPDTDRRGVQFASDVARAFMGDFAARQRLDRHMNEERVERGADQFERAIGAGALTGLVVPSYLVDAFAGYPRADRPLADAMRMHDLPATGLTAYLGKLTTGTTAAEQTSENTAVSEGNADDTLLTIPILTSAGSQTVSRQSSERGVGVEDTIIEDLISAQRANLDSLLLNRASTGLTNVATAIAYTDGTPTAAELYPKLLAGPAAVEAAMLNAHPGDVIAVMHSRRWYWLQSQLTSTWPLFGQPAAAAQNAGQNYAERYGNGFRGILPSGVPVIVDNNIATNLGAGTNEDELYFVSQSESHLWEDPNAPLLIRAEQTSAKTLGIDLVVYAYFAYVFNRVTHAQKINGTGLVTPTF